MSQNDLVIANQSFPATRADINSALQALGSSNSGTTEPATIYANMFWYDTTAKVLKLRSEANDAWISVGYFDQSANAFRILDDTQVTNTSGTQTGLLGGQATATWEAGTGTTESLVSPAQVKAAVVDTFIPDTLNASGSAPIYAARAWVNFKGTGSISIRASGNVSSVTDRGTGDYTINFATPMPDNDYAYTASSADDDTTNPWNNAAGSSDVSGYITSSSIRIATSKDGSSNDSSIVTVAIFR